NQGTINDNGAAQLLMARDGAHVANSGAITAWTKDNFNNGVTRAGIIIAGDTGSVSENKAGGNITLLSDQKPFDSGGISVYPLKWYGNTYYAMLAYNYGEVSNDAGATIMLQGAGVYGVSAAKGTASNAGDIYLDGFVPTLDDAGNITSKTFWQPANLNITSAGMVAGSTDSGNGDATATNTGTITVNNAGFGMMALNGGTAINQGTITLTADEGVTQADENQLVGMAALNGGTVYIDDSVTGSGFIKQNDKTIEGSGEYGAGTEVHYVDFTAPTEPTIDDSTTTMATGDISTSSGTNNLSGYIVGTSANGSAGKLMVSNASLDGVEINTGFTAGTADTTVTFDNVVEGSNLSDAGAIQSTTVVWNAQGSTDSSGNVDVTMTKNAYADVATDSSVSDVAQALDAGYTNNELYTSLNVGTTAELNNALKQISGSQATTVFREARILSNRFTMLADAAPQIKDGLAFNVVAKGDPRAELGNDTQYDMLALRQTLDLTASQNLTLEYGIARLDGGGSQKAGDNGLTGGYSQFFGLKHNMAFGEGLAWNNSLRYDVHNLDSSRSVDYSDVNKVADSDARQQYMEFRSEGAKTFSLMDDALKVTPYAGVKFRHTMEDGYKERSAGDFNLSMNSGNETAVDSLVGLNLDYTGKDGWSATATLEGGPNLSYNKSQRTASLQGAAGQSFSVDDGQKGGGVNGQATIGVKYSSNDTALHLDAYQWKEDSISDKGFMLNVKKTFR
ncbi:autotransporter domain-containing protein, partial [Salmonella enterica]|nr:autotransporter domain-containing protein [Salmonella enterica]